MGHMACIARVPAHPIGKAKVVDEQSGVVSTHRQPSRLSFLVDVEEAHRDPIESVGGWRGEHLAGGDRVSTKEQMTALGQELEPSLDDRLSGVLTPGDRGRLRDIDHVAQLHAFDPRAKFTRDEPPHSRRAGAAGARDEQEHPSDGMSSQTPQPPERLLVERPR